MNDPLSKYLFKLGYQLENYYWLNTNIEIGIKLKLDDSFVVFKLDEANKSVLIIKIVQKNQKQGLAIGIKPIIVLAKAACECLESDYVIEGIVDVFSYSRLDNERSEKMYKLFGAEKNKDKITISIKKINKNRLKKFL